jgi:hypothetical protein
LPESTAQPVRAGFALRASLSLSQQFMLKSIVKTIACAGGMASNGTLQIFCNVEISSRRALLTGLTGGRGDKQVGSGFNAAGGRVRQAMALPTHLLSRKFTGALV